MSDSVRPRTGWLACLLLATFVVGTDDFVIAGVLPAISGELGVSEAAAGQLVTVFSVTYAVAAPPLAVATARLPRRALVAGGLAVFALVNLGAALVPGYTALMVMRVLAALVAAALTPAVFALVGQVAPPDRVGRAMGVVAAGLTASLFAGVPIGTLLGASFGWRSTFVAVGLLACAAAVLSGCVLPSVPGAPEAGVKRQLRVLGRPAVLLCVAGTVAGAASGLMTYTYLAPLTHDLTGRGGSALAALIAVAGAAGAAGTFVCGRLTDRWGADRTLLVTFAGVVAATAALALLGAVGAGRTPVWLMAAVVAVWGLCAWGFNPPMNTRTLRLAGDAGAEAVALNTSGLYVGIAVAGAVGGIAVAAHGGTGVAATAGVLGAAALALMAVSVLRYPGASATAPEGTAAP